MVHGISGRLWMTEWPRTQAIGASAAYLWFCLCWWCCGLQQWLGRVGCHLHVVHACSGQQGSWTSVMLAMQMDKIMRYKLHTVPAVLHGWCACCRRLIRASTAAVGVGPNSGHWQTCSCRILFGTALGALWFDGCSCFRMRGWHFCGAGLVGSM